MSSTETDTLSKYARLETFIGKLQKDIYPENPSGLHDNITRQMFERLQTEMPLPKDAKILDIGCGQGVALKLFKEAGYDALGISLGEDVKQCKAQGLNAMEMNLAFLDFPDNEFDMIWCRHSLEHSIFPLFSLSEMYRVLRPNGVLYVEVPAPDTSCHHERNPNHYSVLGKRMWTSLIGRVGFPNTRIIDLNFTTQAGPDTYWAFMQRKPA